jgi:hypothetical protein
MSIKLKIEKNFKNIVIKFADTVPKKDLHVIADFIELVALFSNGNLVTRNDIFDRLKDEGLIQQSKKSELQAEENDKIEGIIKNIFDLLDYRESSFAANYPFVVDKNKSILITANLSDKQKIYIYLLLSSSLNCFSAFEPELTKEFEKLCSFVLMKYLPKYAIIKEFGKNTSYVGSALTKITQLGKELNLQVNLHNLNTVNVAGNQERGLDLFAVLPFKDQVSNFIIFMCQCTCQKDWQKKIAETKTFEKYFIFDSTKPIHSFFMPYSLVQHNNSFFYKSDVIDKSLIFERGRILEFIEEVDFFQHFESLQLVEKCINYEEDIV